MSVYALLNHLHILLAALSALGLLLRGYFRIVRNQPLLNPMLKIGPHVIDTLLIFTGIALWLLLGYSLLSWLGLKLLLVVVYPTLAVLAFRVRPRHPALGAALFIAAVLVFAVIIGLAIHKPL